jgi:antitoxin component YwqK of YwqJK toxin-antitoxin module
MDKTFVEAIASNFKKLKFFKRFLVLFPDISPGLSIESGRTRDENDLKYNILYLVDEEIVETGFWDNVGKIIETYHKDGLKNGTELEWHENGTLAAKGRFENGLREGIVTEWYENGVKKTEATFHNGQLNGWSEEWDSNGQNAAEGNYQDDRRVGNWTYWDDDGDSHEVFESGWDI